MAERRVATHHRGESEENIARQQAQRLQRTRGWLIARAIRSASRCDARTSEISPVHFLLYYALCKCPVGCIYAGWSRFRADLSPSLDVSVHGAMALRRAEASLVCARVVVGVVLLSCCPAVHWPCVAVPLCCSVRCPLPARVGSCSLAPLVLAASLLCVHRAGASLGVTAESVRGARCASRVLSAGATNGDAVHAASHDGAASGPLR